VDEKELYMTKMRMYDTDDNINDCRRQGMDQLLQRTVTCNPQTCLLE